MDSASEHENTRFDFVFFFFQSNAPPPPPPPPSPNPLHEMNPPPAAYVYVLFEIFIHEMAGRGVNSTIGGDPIQGKLGLFIY